MLWSWCADIAPNISSVNSLICRKTPWCWTLLILGCYVGWHIPSARVVDGNFVGTDQLEKEAETLRIALLPRRVRRVASKV